MKKIFEPMQFHNLTLNNRLIRSATWEGTAEPDGTPMPIAYEIYDELARGGIGVTGTYGNVDLSNADSLQVMGDTM